MATDNSLDMAIDGAGFFQVLMPDGQMGYTRNGTFSRNGEGTLTTSSGYVVQPEIQIPEGTNEINVSSDGIISVMLAGQQDPQEVGQISLANFVNPQGNPRSAGFGKLSQGFLEGSNVNVVQQLVSMIETQRAYEVSSKSISAVDEMMRFLSNNL